MASQLQPCDASHRQVEQRQEIPIACNLRPPLHRTHQVPVVHLRTLRVAQFSTTRLSLNLRVPIRIKLVTINIFSIATFAVMVIISIDIDRILDIVVAAVI